MNPVQDGVKTPRKRENSAKSGKVGMSVTVKVIVVVTMLAAAVVAAVICQWNIGRLVKCLITQI